MQTVIVKENQAGQRFDKFLRKYLSRAQSSFIYKMLRKKNITLNGKKAEGREILCVGDEIYFYFSDETFDKFTGTLQDTGTVDDIQDRKAKIKSYQTAYQTLQGVKIVYEEKDILIVDKPAGMLSQKASAQDISLNEWFIGYLLHTKAIEEEELQMFRPSVCNRLDRNTSGLVLCGKTLSGSQQLTTLIKSRSIRKFYRLFVKGEVKEAAKIQGYLCKQEKTNTVTISATEEKAGSYIKTAYEPLSYQGDKTLLEVELFTGKTHQIRAHLASIGHPLLGDYKYGDKIWNDIYKKQFGITHQILHAYRLEFPVLDGCLSGLSGKVFVADLPPIFQMFGEYDIG